MASSLFRSPGFWATVGVAAVGVGIAMHRRRSALLGRGSAGPEPVLVRRNPAKLPPITETRHEGGITMTRYEAPTITIDQRLKLIQKRIWDGVNDPRMRRLALKITAGCGRDDGECEARKIFDAVKARVRYTGDIGPVMNPRTGVVEGIDVYQRPWLTWDMGGGDCDDAIGVTGSLLAWLGHTVRLRTSAPSKFSEYAHIYPVTFLPKDNPKRGQAVDITLPWKAQLGSEARYGKARDYLIEAAA